ncbi:hypothetical protein CBP31_11245 [Oceanisphaera profunda]|uniref:Secretion system X translation initiation factor n=1 Tax=Oceanisphaera profunda TaxID=1416627 RepID=A0A1Y0D6F4_9GAMM|nr:hypothetical protein [Oceanisphaera profunda]ART83119.1 hypothetical protein CBP31_11245 [Oceanisphaera profunda]
MHNRKRLYWIIFFGLAGIIAVVPEYFFTEKTDVIGVTQADFSLDKQGQLAALRSGPESTKSGKQELGITAKGHNIAVNTDLFASHSWYVAPQRAPVVVAPVSSPLPPPKPMTPPLPFRFIGKLDDSQKVRVFLQQGEKVYVVSVGDVIDGTYRVDGVTDNLMTLLYLPLQVTQSLSVGSKL